MEVLGQVLVPSASARFTGGPGSCIRRLARSMLLQSSWYGESDLSQAIPEGSRRSEVWGNGWRRSRSPGERRGLQSPVLMSNVVFSSEAKARLVAVVGTGSLSPFGEASWREVMDQMARKLAREDRGWEMVVCEDQDLSSPGNCRCRAALKKADILIIVNVGETASVRILVDDTSAISTVVVFNSHRDLMAMSRLGGVPAPVGLERPVTAALPFKSNRKTKAAVKKVRALTEIWNRVSSDNILFALKLLIHNYVSPVKSLQSLQATGLKPLVCMMRHCGPQLLACLTDPQAREALIALQECDPADQFCSYKCIVEAESPVLAAFSLCALQQHNCLDLCAKLPTPTHQTVPPLDSFRGQPMTHSLAENLLMGWIQELGWSWRIVGSLFAIANLFSCQHQIFYRDPANGCLWYDPVFRGTSSQDGKPYWRKRHYKVVPADRPGSFLFSVLDNGVLTRELWTIVHVAEDMSWGLFYYLGAAERAGQSFTGAVVVTHDGQWPDHQEWDRLNTELEKCGIKAWEIVRIDQSACAPNECLVFF